MRQLRRLLAACLAIAVVSSCGGGGNSGPPPPSITASSLPAGTTGAAYAGYAFTASGGTPPFSWSESGSLPPGLRLSASGQLSGTPATAGTYPITVTATDSSMPPLTASVPVSLKVSDSPIVIAPATPASGTVGNPYTGFSYTANGGSPPYSWKVTSGSAPPGLAVGTDGSVSGTPTTTGTFSFSVTATDSAQTPVSGPAMATQIVINSAVFTLTGQMFNKREAHTATLLGDGRVLVTGGMHWEQLPICAVVCDPWVLTALATAEIYDPALGQFAPTTKMSVPRVFHTATLLTNGKVLIAGGDDRRGTDYASAELFDPATSVFAPTGTMVSPRSSHTATLLSDGRVLVSGGVGGGAALATAELFDPATGKFTQTGDMTGPRFFHTATLLTNGRVLIAGGDNGSGVTSTAELYNPATGTFTATGNMSGERTAHRATLLLNGTVLVTGGSAPGGAAAATAEIFDPTSGTFAPTGSMQSPRQTHTATSLSDGKVLVTGGVEGVNSNVALSSSELFDPASGTFVDVGDMAVKRSEHTATLLTNGDVLIAGGINFDNAAGPNSLASAELFVGPTAELSSTGVNFGTLAIGANAANTVTLTNASTTTMTISGIAIAGANAGDFAQTHTCGSSLAAGASCSISVTFNPAAAGTRTAALNISDNAPGSPQQVALSGVGFYLHCVTVGGQCYAAPGHGCCAGLTCVALGNRHYCERF
jgi:hypothetical protein